MKILFVSAIYPYPLYSGGQVRIYNLLKQLGRRHDITLLSFIRDEKERQMKKYLPFVKNNIQIMRGKGLQPKYILNALMRNQPMLISTYDNVHMKETIKTALREPFDLIHVEPFYVIPSLPDSSLPLVVSEHNIEYDVYRKNGEKANFFLRPILSSDAEKIKTWEQNTWKKAQAITAVSEEDASVIRRCKGVPPVTAVPNGVDIREFSFLPHTPDAKHPNFTFVGNFLWIPNRDAVKYLLAAIWPAILKRLPDATLTIVGKNIPPFLRTNDRQVIWKEHVSDIRDSYTSSDALVAPLSISGGSKFKILEALASGCPVVTTKEGICGLSLTDDEIAIAQTPGEFADACASIILSPDMWKKKTVKARKIIEQMYSWDHIANVLEKVWEGVV